MVALSLFVKLLNVFGAPESGLSNGSGLCTFRTVSVCRLLSCACVTLPDQSSTNQIKLGGLGGKVLEISSLRTFDTA